MKVKLTCGLVSQTASWAPGEIIEVAADEGQRMIAAGNAEPVETKAKK